MSASSWKSTPTFTFLIDCKYWVRYMRRILSWSSARSEVTIVRTTAQDHILWETRREFLPSLVVVISCAYIEEIHDILCPTSLALLSAFVQPSSHQCASSTQAMLTWSGATVTSQGHHEVQSDCSLLPEVESSRRRVDSNGYHDGKGSMAGGRGRHGGHRKWVAVVGITICSHILLVSLALLTATVVNLLNINGYCATHPLQYANGSDELVITLSNCIPTNYCNHLCICLQ